MMAKLLRAIKFMIVVPLRLCTVRTSVFLGICCFLFSAMETRAQLWDVPALLPVNYAPAPDGMTASVGKESVHISVCRSGVIHFFATPESSRMVRQTQPWMLDPKESCPGAKFQVSRPPTRYALPPTLLKIEFSLKWGNVQYSTCSGESLLREGNAIPRTYEPAELNGEKTFHVEDRFGPDFDGGFLRLGTTSEWIIQLPRSHRGARPEQYGCRNSSAVVQQRLWRSCGTRPL